MTYYRLADRAIPVRLNGRTFLIDDEVSEFEECDEDCHRALELLRAGCDSEVLDATLGARAPEFVGALDEADLLRRSPLPVAGQAWDTQLLYLDDFTGDAEAAQARLRAARVAIIGIGGVGTVAIQHLIGAGVRKLVLFDHDRVAADNLNRQFLFGTADVGRPKTAAAADAVQRVAPDAEVDVVDEFVSGDESLDRLADLDVTLLINAADQPPQLEALVSHAALRLALSVLGASVGRHMGSWGPLVVPGLTPCLKCFNRRFLESMDPRTRALRELMRQQPIRASFGPTNTVVSTLMAKDAISFLGLSAGASQSTNRRCTLDFRTLEVSVREGGVVCECWDRHGLP